MAAYLWQRFLFLGWTGKAVTVLIILYGTGWVFGKLGAVGIAERFGSAGKFVLTLLLAALLMRLVWQLARKPGR